jgi:hypothetical protein
MEKEQAEMKAAFEQQRKEAERLALEKERINEEKLKKIQAELAMERQKAKKMADKKAEIEKHRRRLYPDYYRLETDAELPIPPPASSFKKQPIPPAESPSSRQVQPEKSNTRPTRPVSTPLSELKPVTYFNVDDNDSVPFLLETPQQNK